MTLDDARAFFLAVNPLSSVGMVKAVMADHSLVAVDDCRRRSPSTTRFPSWNHQGLPAGRQRIRRSDRRPVCHRQVRGRQTVARGGRFRGASAGVAARSARVERYRRARRPPRQRRELPVPAAPAVTPATAPDSAAPPRVPPQPLLRHARRPRPAGRSI